MSYVVTNNSVAPNFFLGLLVTAPKRITLQKILHAKILNSLFELLFDELLDGLGVLLIDLRVDQLVLLSVLVEVLAVALQQRLL